LPSHAYCTVTVSAAGVLATLNAAAGNYNMDGVSYRVKGQAPEAAGAENHCSGHLSLIPFHRLPAKGEGTLNQTGISVVYLTCLSAKLLAALATEGWASTPWRMKRS